MEALVPQTLTIHNIPGDCLNSILYYLPGKINRYILSLVCKKWRNAAKRIQPLYLCSQYDPKKEYDWYNLDYVNQSIKFTRAVFLSTNLFTHSIKSFLKMEISTTNEKYGNYDECVKIDHPASVNYSNYILYICIQSMLQGKYHDDDTLWNMYSFMFDRVVTQGAQRKDASRMKARDKIPMYILNVLKSRKYHITADCIMFSVIKKIYPYISLDVNNHEMNVIFSNKLPLEIDINHLVHTSREFRGFLIRDMIPYLSTLNESWIDDLLLTTSRSSWLKVVTSSELLYILNTAREMLKGNNQKSQQIGEIAILYLNIFEPEYINGALFYTQTEKKEKTLIVEHLMSILPMSTIEKKDTFISYLNVHRRYDLVNIVREMSSNNGDH